MIHEFGMMSCDVGQLLFQHHSLQVSVLFISNNGKYQRLKKSFIKL